jgi:hypothetical protein
MRIAHLVLLVVVVALLSVFVIPAQTAYAAAQGYVKFNSPSTVSVTRTERPQLSVQLGNTGTTALTNVVLTCTISQGSASFDVNQVYANGAFSSVTKSSTSLTFSGLASLRVGQNYNVSFAVIPSGSSVIQCTLGADGITAQTASVTVAVR